MQEKLIRLRAILEDLGSVAVAYSGGTDSAFVLAVARDTLGERALALTADSPSVPRAELEDARAVAADLGVEHIILPTTELDDPAYQANTPDRCYFCKSNYLDELLAYAQAHGYAALVDGANADDLGDYRPGQKAARERGVRSPLQEVGLTKAEIRALARGAACRTGTSRQPPASPRASPTARPSPPRRWPRSSAPRRICTGWVFARCACAITRRLPGWKWSRPNWRVRSNCARRSSPRCGRLASPT